MPERSARTVLAFDFGLKRIGVAVGEPELGTAHPLPAIAAPGFDRIEKLVAEWRPAQLVVGLPVAEQGEHALAKRVERFARQLEGRFHLPVARVPNLARAMEELKGAGYWLVGLEERAEKSYTEADFTGAVGIVLGGEGKGLHELVRKRCDFLVSIPTTGPVRALNVSVVAGVVLFEAVRQRRQLKAHVNSDEHR